MFSLVFPSICLLLCGSSIVFGANHDLYSGFSVHSITLKSQIERDQVHQLTLDLGLDVWQHGYVGRSDTVVMVSPLKVAQFIEEVNKLGVQNRMIYNDVSSELKKRDANLNSWRSTRSRSGRLVPFEDHPRYADVDAYLERIAAAYPNEATLVTAGPSFEGRLIKYLRISTTNFEDTSKPVIFVDAGIHAREWVTVPFAIYVINRLLEARVPGEEDMLNNIDWIVLPMVNPDGWEYTFTDDAFWRRTRSFNATNSECYGVDGNRNFDYNFNQYGTSSNTCDDTYPGYAPFSEVETQYVRDILLEYRERIEVYFNVHSFGNWILYGFDDVLAPNSVQLHHLGSLMGAEIDRLKLPEAPYYVVGNGGLVLYPAAGNAQDYAQSIGVPFSYTLELPGYSYWFFVPPSYLDHINHETWQGMLPTARLARLYYLSRNNN